MKTDPKATTKHIAAQSKTENSLKGKAASKGSSLPKKGKESRAPQRVNGNPPANILEWMSDGFVAFDAQMNYTYINERSAILLGRRPEDLIGKNFWKEFPESIGTPFADAYRRALETQAPIQFEDYHTPSGRWLESRVFPTKDGLSVFHTDVTERRREAEETYRALIDQATAGITRTDPGGRFTFVNRTLCEMLGYTESDLVGKTIWEITHPDDIEENKRLFERMMSEGTSFQLEKRLLRRDGSVLWVNISVSAMQDAAGKPQAAVSVVIDISGQKHLEQSLRKSKGRLLGTYEHAPIGIIENSLEGNYVNCNEEFCHITGYEKGELLSFGIKDLTYEEDYIFDIKLHQRLVAGDIPFYKLEKRYIRKDGKVVWAEVSRSLMRDADGKPLYTIGAVLDVSERRQAEQSLRESEARLAIELADTKKLQHISSQLIQEDNINVLYEQIVDAAIGLMRSDMGSIQVFDPEKNELRLLTWKGFDPASAAFWESVRLDSSSTCGMVLKTRERVIVTDVETCDFMAGTQDLDFSRLSGIRAVQSTPLFSRSGRIVGMLSTHWRQQYRPSERDLSLLDVLVRQAADLIERAHAEQASLEFARQQEALYTLADQLHRTNSLEDVFNAALDAILSALQCDRASILLFDNTSVMRFVAWRGLSDEYRKATDGHSPWKPDEKHPEPIGINDINTAELSDSLRAVINGEGIGSLAFIPLVSGGKLIGKFMAYFNAPHVFSEGELDLSLTVARQLAFGIERNRAEEALRASEALYRAIARSIPGGGVYVVDKDLRYLVAEGPVTEAFGLSPEMLEGYTVSEVFPAEAGELMKERLQQNFAGETISYETKHNGRVYWTQQAPLLDSLGHAIVVTIDITERKQIEEALRLSEERFVRFMQHLPGLAWIKDMQGRYVYANAAAEKAFSTPQEELYGKTDQDVFPAKEAAQFKINDEHVLTDGKGVQVIETLEHADGILHYSLVNKFPIPGPDGNTALIGGTAFDITERKQAEEALHESNERYHNLFDLVPVAVYSCDADGLIQEYNHRAIELWGREPQKNDPNEKHCGSFKIYYPDGRFMPHEACPMARMLGGETLEPHELEILIERPDGVQRSVIAHPLVLKNEHAEIIGAINCLYDITERKQAEEKIVFQANLLGAVGSAVIATDLNGIVLYWNPAAEKLYGWSSSEALGKNVVDVAPAPQSQEQAGEIMQGLASGKSWSGDFLVQRRDGSTFPAFVSDSPFLDSNGKLVGIIGVSSDITELKQAEEALQQLNLQLESRVQSRTEKLNNVIEALHEEISERKRAEGQLAYQAQLIANVNDAIIATDPDLAIGYWNQAAEQIYGWKAEEVLGRSIADVLQSEFVDGNTRSEALRKVKETGELRTAVTHLRKDGNRIFIDAHTSTLRNEEGKTIGYISVNHDVTERTQMDEALRKSRERLQLLSQRLVEVQEEERRAIARELHDRVGQTLAALNINLMIMNGQIREDSKQLIGSRMADTMHLVAEAIALVRNVMTDLRPAVLDDYGLEAALQSYIDEYKSRYNIKVILDPLDPPLPRLGPSLEMTLLRITQEALFNIARHAQADTVNISLRLQDNAVHLMVQDNGVGIQSWQDANRPGSHGLTIMRERADAFGGRLNVGSAPGKGTKVEVSIPLQSGNQNKVQ